LNIQKDELEKQMRRVETTVERRKILNFFQGKWT